MSKFIRYEKFLEELDLKLKSYFEFHSSNIKCKSGCSNCCEIGDYPFSELEMKYLMHGFLALDENLKKVIRDKINLLKSKNKGEHFFYECPFLINKKCSVYKYRGITCRTFGLAYITDKKNSDGKSYVKVPECVKLGLNYSDCYLDSEVEVLPIEENLDLPKVIESDLAKKYNFEFGELRSLINWFP